MIYIVHTLIYMYMYVCRIIRIMGIHVIYATLLPIYSRPRDQIILG